MKPQTLIWLGVCRLKSKIKSNHFFFTIWFDLFNFWFIWFGSLIYLINKVWFLILKLEKPNKPNESNNLSIGSSKWLGILERESEKKF